MASKAQPELKRPPKAEETVIAQYWAEPDWWNDVPEAKPRCRVRVPEGKERQMVRVFADGSLDVPKGVTVDHYDDLPHMKDEEIP